MSTRRSESGLRGFSRVLGVLAIAMAVAAPASLARLVSPTKTPTPAGGQGQAQAAKAKVASSTRPKSNYTFIRQGQPVQPETATPTPSPTPRGAVILGRSGDAAPATANKVVQDATSASRGPAPSQGVVVIGGPQAAGQPASATAAPSGVRILGQSDETPATDLPTGSTVLLGRDEPGQTAPTEGEVSAETEEAPPELQQGMVIIGAPDRPAPAPEQPSSAVVIGRQIEEAPQSETMIGDPETVPSTEGAGAGIDDDTASGNPAPAPDAGSTEGTVTVGGSGQETGEEAPPAVSEEPTPRPRKAGVYSDDEDLRISDDDVLIDSDDYDSYTSGDRKPERSNASKRRSKANKQEDYKEIDDLSDDGIEVDTGDDW